VDDILSSAAGPRCRQVGFGNNRAVAAIVARLRSWLARGPARWLRPGAQGHRRYLQAFAKPRWPPRCPATVHVVANPAYAGKALRGLPATITWTTRLRANAALLTRTTPNWPPPQPFRYGAPPRGRRHRGNRGHSLTVVRGLRLPTRAGRPTPRRLGYRYDIALVSTRLTATPAQVIERQAARWSIEVTFEDANQPTGIGEARNRLSAAVERSVPFGLVWPTISICCHAKAG